MSTPSLYVVQVMGGTERRHRERILSALPNVVEDCFIPEYETMWAQRGVWKKKLVRLFPGYLFIQTKDPDALADAVASAPDFMRLLGGSDKGFQALTAEEVAWLDAFTEAGTHVVRMSEGVIEGDRVTVTKGPLRGREGQIARIDRHKRIAELEVRMFNQAKRVKVGLAIVWKKPRVEAG